MQSKTITPPPGNEITCKADIYGCEMPENMPVSITLHPDNDGSGLYVRIRHADSSPLAGLDLTHDQAERLKNALEWALVNAHAKRIKANMPGGE
ncbi:hypothetical protein VSS37_03535 [Candidatus Thiothrix sp. Deng01]|uniref:Uncharacterized protein n=1 Tax=Candidatus Thiothrix phosphatis TaxID=3112415 RepID=A0ABU6CVG9_9GAMM|nr:hypothetical protein [Candidatus Thiothrix sp. Deng01]MEB4590043.1 hypothetical protein [Candidatus Thiothrix sp. Deng01]